MKKDELREEVEREAEECVADGNLEVAGLDAETGEPRYCLTDKGYAAVARALRDCGIDPSDKEAVRRFIFGES